MSAGLCADYATAVTMALSGFGGWGVHKLLYCPSLVYLHSVCYLKKNSGITTSWW